jgi:hypothetical protein
MKCHGKILVYQFRTYAKLSTKMHIPQSLQGTPQSTTFKLHNVTGIAFHPGLYPKSSNERMVPHGMVIEDLKKVIIVYEGLQPLLYVARCVSLTHRFGRKINESLDRAQERLN